MYWIGVKMKNVLCQYLFVQDSYFCARMAAGFVLDVVDNVMTGQVRWRYIQAITEVLIVLSWMTTVDSTLLSGDHCSIILWVTFIHKFTPPRNCYKCTNWFRMCNVKINYMDLHKIFLHTKFCPLEQKNLSYSKTLTSAN